MSCINIINLPVENESTVRQNTLENESTVKQNPVF